MYISFVYMLHHELLLNVYIILFVIGTSRRLCFCSWNSLRWKNFVSLSSANSFIRSGRFNSVGSGVYKGPLSLINSLWEDVGELFYLWVCIILVLRLDVPLMPPLFIEMKRVSNGKMRKKRKVSAFLKIPFLSMNVITWVTRNRGWSSSLKRELGGDTFSFDTSGLRVFYGPALIKSSAMWVSGGVVERGP